MSETCCFVYNDLSTIQMEQFLYHEEYSMYNEDHAIDNMIYYQLFECGGLP